MLAASNDIVAGTKLIKYRLTIAPYSNADSTYKLPLFFIGKQKKQNINLSSLLVYYCNQKSAWMDCNPRGHKS